MSEPLSPQREAIKLVHLWRHIYGASFPVQVGALALEWSKQAVPDKPIGEVLAQELNGFEGGLFWLPTRKEWALLYKPNEDAPGRANFTIAHEFGHYVLHRELQERFQCSQAATLGLAMAKIEREADLFASHLLMPIDDFRAQVGKQQMRLDLMSACAERYGVSLTAAILKWLDFTDQAAILVFAREGMLHWWRASASAKRIGFANLHEGMELPHQSLAVLPRASDFGAVSRQGIEHGAGVWFGDAAREMVVVSDRYDMSISLLILDTPGVQHDDEPEGDMTTQPPSFR